MAQTPEAKVKAQVRKILDAYPGMYTYWPVPTGFGSTTLDVLGAYRGRSFAIETKAPGKKPTLKQTQTIENMERAMMKVFVISGDIGLGDLRVWLTEIELAVPYDPYLSPDQVRRRPI